MVSVILSRLVILVFGLLYPAYASYKAVKTKNIKEYVKWMMYWIVFALFTAAETFSDVLLSWVPFYYEVKMVFVFWLLSPVTQGSSFLYKKFVHPQLLKREKEIDEAIAQARTRGYSTLMTLGHKGLTYATNVVVKTAIKGQSTLVERVRSYSVNDLRLQEESRRVDEIDAPYIDDSDEEFGIDLTQNFQQGNTDNSFAQQYPQITDTTQNTSGNIDSVITLPEKTSQTEVVSNRVEGSVDTKSHKSTQEDKNGEASDFPAKLTHNKTNISLIKKVPASKTGTTTTQKLPQKKADSGITKNRAKSDNRLQADNRELEERGQRREQVGGRKKETQRRKPLSRSHSDATEIRQHRAGKTLSGLSRLEEVEHEHLYMEHSEKQDEENREEEEEVETMEEEVIYYNPRKSGHYTAKEVKSDPYATLPRTRSRQRPRLNQY